MKEHELKALIKKGKLETSPDFTNQLIQKISIAQEQKKIAVWPYRVVFGAIAFLIGGLTYFLITDAYLFVPILLKTVKKPLLFIIFVLLYFSLNHIIRLHEIYKKKEKDIILSQL